MLKVKDMLNSKMCDQLGISVLTLSAFTCSKLTIETREQGVK